MTTVAGACTRAGYLPAVLRSAWVRRERPAPGPDREEHRPRHRGARRQPAAGSQVLSHRLLHGRRDHVELPKVHPTQVNKAATKQKLFFLSEQSNQFSQPEHFVITVVTQALRCGHSRPRRQLLVVRLAVERVVGGLVPAAPAGPVGCLGGTSLAVADLLVEQPEDVPGVERHRLQPRAPLRGRQAYYPQIRVQDLHGTRVLLKNQLYTRTDNRQFVQPSICHTYDCCSRRSGSRGSTSACTAT
jgi:hypothetical protein